MGGRLGMYRVLRNLGVREMRVEKGMVNDA